MDIISVVLDGIILALLAATVFYAARLSSALKQFRDGKAEFAQLLTQLNQATGQADQSIKTLQKSTEDSGHDLQLRINSGKALSEELQLMTEAATNLADRLEKMAEQNTEIVSRMERAAGLGGEALDLGGTISRSKSKNVSTKKEQEFSIRDNELDEPFADAFDDELESVDIGDFGSKAEKDLADALKKRK